MQTPNLPHLLALPTYLPATVRRSDSVCVYVCTYCTCVPLGFMAGSEFAQTPRTQLIKTCSIICLSICLFNSGSCAISCIFFPSYFSTPAAFSVKDSFTVSDDVRDAQYHLVSHQPHNPSSLPHSPSHVPDMGVICLPCVRCDDVG